MREGIEKHSGGVREKLPLLKRLLKGDKVIWVLFLLLNMVDVYSSQFILNHINGNFWFALLMGSVIQALCVAMTILVLNVDYRYFKVIMPLGVIAAFMLIDEMTVKQFSLIALVESVLCMLILVRTAKVVQRCRGLFPVTLAIGIALLMVMHSFICVGAPGGAVIVNCLFVGVILCATRATMKMK